MGIGRKATFRSKCLVRVQLSKPQRAFGRESECIGTPGFHGVLKREIWTQAKLSMQREHSLCDAATSQGSNAMTGPQQQLSKK